jgi:hypothetical protein
MKAGESNGEMGSGSASVRRVCLGCLHDLTDASSRCPECGRPFDPENPRTWWRGRPVWIERPFMRCGRWFHAAIVLAVVVLWFDRSVPAGNFLAEMGSAALLLSLAVVLVLKILTRIEVRLRLGGPGPIAAREWGWITAPAIAISGVALANTTLPLRLGFLAASGRLEGWRAQFEASPSQGMPSGSFAGWYGIDRFDRCWLFTQDAPPEGWPQRGQANAWIVNVVSDRDLAADPTLGERFKAAVENPAALLRPGSEPPPGMRVVEVALFEVAGSGFLDTGYWGWLPKGPDALVGAEMRWTRVVGEWYAVKRGF